MIIILSIFSKSLGRGEGNNPVISSISDQSYFMQNMKKTYSLSMFFTRGAKYIIAIKSVAKCVAIIYICYNK